MCECTMTDDSDVLFTEASEELEEDIRDELDEAEEKLPDADDVWNPEGENIIGVLNQLQSSVNNDDVVDHVKEARKSFLLGDNADAFSEDDADEFETRINRVVTAVDQLGDVHSAVDELIPVLPGVKESLDNVKDASGDGASDDSVTEGGGVEDEVEDNDSDVENAAVEDEDSELDGADDGVVDDEDSEDDSGGDGSDGPAESWGG